MWAQTGFSQWGSGEVEILGGAAWSGWAGSMRERWSYRELLVSGRRGIKRQTQWQQWHFIGCNLNCYCIFCKVKKFRLRQQASTLAIYMHWVENWNARISGKSSLRDVWWHRKQAKVHLHEQVRLCFVASCARWIREIAAKELSEG